MNTNRATFFVPPQLRGGERRLLALLLLVAVCGCGLPAARRATAPGALYQYATLQSLIEGVYDGDCTLAHLRRQGDFGLGTFNRLDGEMILYEGRFYRVGADGQVTHPPLDWRTPFACVLFFQPTQRWDLPAGLDYAAFQTWLDERLGSLNYPAAIRVEAAFKSVHTRSVPAQVKPYPRLPDVARTQPEFHFAEATGALIGFRLPAYVAGLNLAGYHLHFLTQDRTGGGHLLDFVTRAGVVEVDTRTRFFLELPTDADFAGINLEDDKTDDVHAVER